VTFPVPGVAREVPTGSWHIDAPYGLPVRPLRQVKLFSLLADLEPAGGGTMLVAGSHHVMAHFGAISAPETLAKNTRARHALLRSHPWLDALRRPGDPATRVEQLMQRDGDVDGVRVRVVELTGRAGDVVLVHPSVLHARPVNCRDTPRFMLAKDIPARGEQ
jgi:ectoine hydroxylase-related dioxygenase (phytanoyl-CoA dioxygenase family)